MDRALQLIVLLLVAGGAYALGSGAVVIQSGDIVGVGVDPGTVAKQNTTTTATTTATDTADLSQARPTTTMAGTPTATPRPTMPATETATATSTPTTLRSEIKGYERETLRTQIRSRVNDYRDRHGHATVDWHVPLRKAAQAHAQDMIEQDFFAHESPDGTTFGDRMAAVGEADTRCGENLYQIRFSDNRFSGLESEISDRAIESWRGSSEHLENMAGEWDNTGVGIGIADEGAEIRVVIVQVFCDG